MRLVFAFIITALISFCKPTQDKPSREIIINGTAQGTTYHIIYFAQDSIVTKASLDSILQSLDSSLSIYKPYSLISTFNRSEKGIEIDSHFRNVINASLETFKATGGLFDITVGPLVEAWGFAAKHPTVLPDSATIQSLLGCIGSRNISLRGSFLSKQKSCIKIDVNGIAQGYSVDVLAGFMESRGIQNYLVELGGEIRVQGRKLPGHEQMKVGIESPGGDEFEPGLMQQVLALDNGAITTSGNYRKYYESNGKKISHLIDPRTGYSIQNELISATVYAKKAVTADAFDNALMVMGLDSALRFAAARNDIEAYFIYKKDNGSVADTATTGFYSLMHADH